MTKPCYMCLHLHVHAYTDNSSINKCIGEVSLWNILGPSFEGSTGVTAVVLKKGFIESVADLVCKSSVLSPFPTAYRQLAYGSSPLTHMICELKQ